MRYLTQDELDEFIGAMVDMGMSKEDIMGIMGWIDSDLHMKDLMEIFRQYDFKMTTWEVMKAASKVITKYKDMDYDEIPQE